MLQFVFRGWVFHFLLVGVKSTIVRIYRRVLEYPQASPKLPVRAVGRALSIALAICKTDFREMTGLTAWLSNPSFPWFAVVFDRTIKQPLG